MARTTTKRRKRLNRRWLILAGYLVVIAGVLIFSHYHAGEPKQQTVQTPHVATKVSTPPQSQTVVPTEDAALNQIIANWTKNYNFSATAKVIELNGQQRQASYRATTSVIPGSTYKIYVAYAVLHAIEQGTYTLNSPTSGGYTIQQDLTTMIVNSDNAAARRLGFMLGWKNINSLLATQSVTSTNLYNYVPPSTDPVGDKHTTATDLSTILKKLYAGQLLNSDHTALLLSLMKQQHYRSAIPAGVPSGVTVADKPGWLTPADGETGYTYNDAGIVYGPKSDYLIVVTTAGSSPTPLANLSKQVYNYLQN